MKLRYQICLFLASIALIAGVASMKQSLDLQPIVTGGFVMAIVLAQVAAIASRIQKRWGLEKVARDCVTERSVSEALYHLRHQLVSAEDSKWRAINHAIICLESVRRFLTSDSVKPHPPVSETDERPEVMTATEQRDSHKPGSLQYMVWDQLVETWRKFPSTKPDGLETARANREDFRRLSAAYDKLVQAIKQH